MTGGVVRFKAIALPLLFGLAAFAMSGDAQTPPETTVGHLLTWPELIGRPRPAPDHVIHYGEHAQQVVDLYLPAGNGPHPVVIMIHGGCWSQPWDRSLMNWISDDLRRRGIAVWNIDYRTLGEHDRSAYPSLFMDVASAADALRAHASEYRLDLSRVVTVGHSAGGHLALWLAGRRNLPRGHFANRNPLPIHAAISLGGLQDLELAERPPGSGCGTEVIGRLIGRGLSARRDLFADTSAPRMGPLRIPQVLINGNQDRIIPTHFAEDYARQMRAMGDDVRVRMIDATGHVELVAPESAAWAAAVEESERALRR
jgi:acetyl esterase/lipase